jgi:5,6-dimethylbenzimidazole synthase
MTKRLAMATVLATTALLVIPPCLRAEEAPGLTPGQQFFFDTVAARRSVRAFKIDAVSQEHLLKILDAARLAATSGNQQPWKFLVVRDPKRREALKQACLEAVRLRIEASSALDEAGKKEKRKQVQDYYDTCFTAPLFVVVLVDQESKYPDYNHFDGPMAAANLMLAARALGYGTVFYTDTIPDEVTRKVLEIPGRYQRVCITPIGVPTEWPKAPTKKELSEFIVYDSFAAK